MYSEDDLLPISALQHLMFCERQCALIHVERLWVENRFTAEGRILHKKVDSGRSETRKADRAARSLPVRSLELGLFGIADVARYERGVGDSIIPVEYKRGRPKTNDCDRVQLCAQALCLEEMHGASIPFGEIFYGKTRRKVRVEFAPELRRATVEAAARLHALIRSGRTPSAEFGPKCERCSLRGVCMPRLGGGVASRAKQFDRAVDALLAAPLLPGKPSS